MSPRAGRTPSQAEPASRAADPPLDSLKGVGPRRLELLERIGVERVRDLLLLLPRRLESTGEACTLKQAANRAGRVVQVEGRVTGRRFNRFGKRSSLRPRS